MAAVMPDQLDPSRIMQLGEGFMASKTLLSAIELELFTHLGSTALTASQIKDRLGLHQRAVPDFHDALLALGMLTRHGDGREAGYANTADTAAFLDKRARPISAVSWRCATPGFAGSGVTLPRR